MTDNTSSNGSSSDGGRRRSLPGMQIVIFGDTILGWTVRILVVAAPALVLNRSGFVMYSLVWGFAALVESIVKETYWRMGNLALGFLFAMIVGDPSIGWLYAAATAAEWFSDRMTPSPK